MPPELHELGPELYDSLQEQFEGGSWRLNFNPRERDQDPWGLGVGDPSVVHFEAPEDQKDKVEELSSLLYGAVRSRFINDGPWEQLVGLYDQVFNNKDVVNFASERNANLISITPHTMFADLGITAGAAGQVMDHLDPEHPFGGNDPARTRQRIVAGRMLAHIVHEELGFFTGGLPVLEGLMLPLAGVTTTHSANGSSRLARKKFGEGRVKEMNQLTRQDMETQMTHGGHHYHIAPHGTQVKYDPKGYEPVRMIQDVSSGTRESLISVNKGDYPTRKNMILGVAIDCPSIQKEGIIPQDAGIGLMPEIYVPTETNHIELIMKAMAISSNRYKISGLPVFRYGEVDENPNLSRKERKVLEKIKLTDLRDAA